MKVNKKNGSNKNEKGNRKKSFPRKGKTIAEKEIVTIRILFEHTPETNSRPHKTISKLDYLQKLILK